ncbi:MAG: hypothetical protein SF029_18625 [bacterium]|nr:hypothetical protein [bacterium]
MVASRELLVETVQVNVAGQPMSLSIMTFEEAETESFEVTRLKLSNAYQRLAQEFLSQPCAAYQKSACVITDVTSITVTQDMLNTWADQASSDDIQTNQYLISLFKRPAFLITAIRGIDVGAFAERLQQINANANPVIYVDSRDHAISEAVELLRIAHRY